MLTKTLSVIEIVKALSIFSTHHGLPHIVIMDRGTEVKNTVVLEFFKTYKIKIHSITINNPESNAAIDWLLSTLKEH